MLTRIEGGVVYDPIQGIDGEVRDIWIEDGRIVADPGPGARAERTIDARGRIVMAGGIDLHSHIGGGKVNIARMLLPEEHRLHRQAASGLCRCGSGLATPSTFTTGYAYARMGYTAAFEPAMLPANARQAHHEMADIPIIDKGAYALLGNDDFLLGLLRDGEGPDAIADYVAWTIEATQALAIKVVNPGGISAFKFNGRKLDLDEAGPYYAVTPRRILTALADALNQLSVPHPLHVHGCNLGVPGGDLTTLATIEAMKDRRIHLTHLQFHSYATGAGGKGIASGAARIAELLRRSPHVTVDVGQVMFGQTVTASADTMSQHRTSRFASPKKWVAMDIECEAGCGVVPFRYRDRNLVHALQWMIGLELFLLVDDPWRVFLTTDHPNGAPFTTYPHLIRLLMDRSFRNDMLATLPASARALTSLPAIEREYSLYEIAILTRAGPARILGIDATCGHLGQGAVADVTIYRPHADAERMFESPELVLKAGETVVEDGRIVGTPAGATHIVRPGWDAQIERRLEPWFADHRAMRLDSFRISDGEIEDEGRGRLIRHPLRSVSSNTIN